MSDAHPEGAEVARDQAGEDRQRRAAFARRGDDLVDVLRVRTGEDLGEFGNEHGRQGAATDDRGQLPPQVPDVVAQNHEIAEQQPAHANEVVMHRMDAIQISRVSGCSKSKSFVAVAVLAFPRSPG